VTAAFQYHPDVLARFPDVVGGVILARGMRNAPTPDALLHAYQAEQQAVLARIGKTPLSELPSLAAWRGAFRAFGVEPTQYRSAAEALLRRLTKKGDIPSINTLVDIGNLVSIRYALPIAVVDTRALEGTITVHFAEGTERFLPLGEGEAEHPEPGEVVFSDPTGRVIARRWCWRQSDDSAAREATTDAIITIEAHHAGGCEDVQAAMDDVLQLLQTYAGGTYTSAVLGREQPAIMWTK
jgi:DNA/RNA-binding domain of Phe-tRNA-synthetase-like protein